MTEVGIYLTYLQESISNFIELTTGCSHWKMDWEYHVWIWFNLLVDAKAQRCIFLPCSTILLLIILNTDKTSRWLVLVWLWASHITSMCLAPPSISGYLSNTLTAVKKTSYMYKEDTGSFFHMLVQTWNEIYK